MMSPFPDNNPYNFIPFGPPVRFSPAPPSLKRLQGLSGTITLHLTNETPMLVAQRVNPEDQIPPKLENFKINGKLALPGTAIKGMLRSVLEAVTNACFVIFDGERLDYRMATQEALHLKAGRITRMPGDGQDGEIEEMDRAWIAMPGNNQIKAMVKGKPQSITLATVPAGTVSGQEVWVKGIAAPAYINSRGNQIPAPSGSFNLVTDIRTRPTTGFSKAVYKITAQSINNKKRDRVFVYKSRAPRYSFSAAEVEDYNTVLAGQLTEHQKRGGFDLTEDQKLAVGALVYFLEEGGRAVRLSRVEIPRTRYDSSRADRLPRAYNDAYHKCTDPDHLCAACQLFGFVADIHGARGRITVTDAQWLSGPGELDQFFPLKVLGEPHPTSYNFYLIDPHNANKVRNYDGRPITDNRGRLGQPAGDVQLRGRKFYFHHPLKDWAAYRCPDPHQFRRVLNEVKPLQPGNKFKFHVHFRNLSNAELGLLLYCLILESNLRHKLGLARALGFGTVKLECQSLLLNRDGDRYASLDASLLDETDNIQRYIDTFKAAVPQSNPEGVSFDDLENVKKLRKILDPSQAPANPYYPGFAWYRDHKDKALQKL
ncbi:MAG: TIGR03986 family CRISPR-associated RAMP protein [Desulfobacca sp.]|nr:TIGR03986 family CRISPR-associated RAMP protein [Desulfobacca sp.]